MKKIGGVILFLMFVLSATGIDKNKPSSIANKTKVSNSSFESDEPTQVPTGWSSEGTDLDADFTSPGGFSGKYSLRHEKNGAYKIFTYQQINNLKNGYYSLTAHAKNSGGQNACYLVVKDYGEGEPRITSLPVSTTSWTPIIVRGIHVTNGTCKIGLLSDANANNWCNLDDIELTKDDKPYVFLKGGDLSELSYIEQKGGKFYEDGVQKDCFAILKNNGFNFARLRLYNDPGNAAFTPSKNLPLGVQNATDILHLAKRAKDSGMQIQLTFHYSDFWTNGETQNKPHDWSALSYDDLKTAVYNFTFDFMKQMKNQGTTPEYVSLGNEIGGGILFPDGSISNFSKLAELLNKGYDAVKAVAPDSKVILHLDDAGNAGKYDWFFGELSKHGIKYDIIGASYYPFWTKKTVTQIRDWANYESTKLGKDILIMETGYNWNPVRVNGHPGQLANNGPYDTIYPSSPQGQLDFLYECFNGLKLATGGKILGDIYWDPIMIAVPDVGWQVGGDNVVSNTTLFDFSGNTLPSLQAFKYNN